MSSSSSQTNRRPAEAYDLPAYEYTTSPGSIAQAELPTKMAGAPSALPSADLFSSSSESTLPCDDSAPASASRASVYRTSSGSTCASSTYSASSYTPRSATLRPSVDSPISFGYHMSSPRSYADDTAGGGNGSTPRKPNVNVYTTCGRHSNEWLFSGWPSPFRRRDGN
ncbi:MAG: hypothetical protein STHCBS139747_006272 [Sporothrix thermara]